MIESIADPGYNFARPDELTVTVASVTGSAGSESEPVIADAVFAPGEQSLEERIVRADLVAALTSLGFSLVEDPQDAAMVLYFTETLRERSYESYERVPVSRSTIGFGWGRGRHSDFYSTTYSTVVVPVTRTEMVGTIWVAATPLERAQTPSSADRSPADIAVWLASLTTDATDLQGNRLSHLRQLLSFWGQTTRTVVEVPVEP